MPAITKVSNSEECSRKTGHNEYLQFLYLNEIKIYEETVVRFTVNVPLNEIPNKCAFSEA